MKAIILISFEIGGIKNEKFIDIESYEDFTNKEFVVYF